MSDETDVRPGVGGAVRYSQGAPLRKHDIKKLCHATKPQPPKKKTMGPETANLHSFLPLKREKLPQKSARRAKKLRQAVQVLFS